MYFEMKEITMKLVNIIICYFIFGIGLYAQTPNWVYRYNGQASGYDFGYSLVYGNDGNIYSAGKAYAGYTSQDFVITSTTSSGIERWVYNYNGLANSTDCANAIMYGNDNNIYAAGYSKENSDDIIVVSLDTSGNERWVYHYNGPIDSIDYINAIIYGDDGNIYITGGSYGIGSMLDIIVISLTPDGNERWVYRYNGQGNRDDCAYSLVYDNNSIYVAGYAGGFPSVTKKDFVVISLDTAGSKQWSYTYNGTSSGDDCASSIICDNNNNIYVAGYCQNGSEDILVISLLNTGAENWTHLYNGTSNGDDRATSLIYGNNKLYMSGKTWSGSSNGIDFLIMSMDTAGTEQWVYKYNGPSSDNDYAHSIIYGNDGNLYSSGYSRDNVNSDDFIVLSVNDSGSERWVYRHNGTGNTYDLAYAAVYGDDGNIYAVGNDNGIETKDDFITISLNSNGNEQWVYRYDGLISGSDKAYSVVYGQDNSVYAAGESYGGGSAFQRFTIAGIDNTGTEQWVYRYSDTANTVGSAHSLINGSDGNLYATGKLSSNDFAIVSLTNSGNERWVYHYDYNNNMDCGYKLVYGTDGNIYATGTSWGGSNDFIIISLSSSGTERWVYRYNGSASQSDDHGHSIVYGEDGNVYAAGYSKESGSGYDFTVISLNSSGSERWVYHHNVPVDSGGAAYSIVYGNDNNIYIAGYDYSPSFDFVVISLDTLGQERWVYRHNGLGDGYDMAKHIIYGDDGNLYIVGHTEGVGTSLDFTVVSLDTSGTERWVYRYNGPWNVADFAEYVVYGTDDNIYVTGGSYDSGPSNELEDFIVACLDTYGNEKWVYLYNGPGNGPDYAYQLDYGNDGNLYIAGLSLGIGTKEDFTVLSLDPLLGIKKAKKSEVNKSTDLYLSSIQSKNGIDFSIFLPHKSLVNIHLYNVLGQVIYTKDIIAEKGMSEHYLKLSLSSGIYFLQLNTDKDTKRAKICVVK